MRDGWGEPYNEPRPDYRDATEPVVPMEHEGKPGRGERAQRFDAVMADPVRLVTSILDDLQTALYGGNDDAN